MKKITVTIGIPAYNEAHNIAYLLNAIFTQQLHMVTIKEILVYSDASTDKTNHIVTTLAKKYPNIRLLVGKKRRGKYFRVNELFALCKTEILVLLDADIALNDKDFIEALVTALAKDKKAVMMVSQVKYMQPKGFMANIIYTSFVLEAFISMSVPGFDISENFHGAATAYRNSFVKTIAMPVGLIDPHLYIYLSARKVKGFRMHPDAIILQYIPTTIKDVKQLMQRSIGKKDPIILASFDEKFIRKARYIAKRYKIIGIWKCFLWNPFYTPFALMVRLYFGKLVKIKKIDKTPIWKINSTTKKRFSYGK
jgi:glycosyltransferase involved in cell wall biosynthesis